MKLLFIVLGFWTICTSQQNTSSLNANEQKSQLTWTGKAAFSSYALSGTIPLKAGQIHLDASGAVTAVQLSINTKGIASDISRLTKHLKSADFFDVKKHPTATFESDTVTYEGPNQLSVTGQMTIKGIQRPETFSVKLSTEGKVIVGLAKVKINRTDYGISYNSPSLMEKLKEEAIDDWFEVECKLVFGK